MGSFIEFIAVDDEMYPAYRAMFPLHDRHGHPAASLTDHREPAIWIDPSVTDSELPAVIEQAQRIACQTRPLRFRSVPSVGQVD